MTNTKYCFMTLATTPTHLHGGILNYYALKNVNSIYPFFIMIPEYEKNWMILLNNLKIPYKPIKIYKFNNKEISSFNDTINKFQVFNYTEYDKICFLDADILVFFNMDNIFSLLKETKCYSFSPGKNSIENFGGFFLIKPQKIFLINYYMPYLK